jgi:hypothetical protein
MEKLTQIICGNAKFDSHFNLIRGIRSCRFCNKTEVVKGQSAIGPLEKFDNLRFVEAKYVLNKTSETWEPRTMFPTLRKP